MSLTRHLGVSFRRPASDVRTRAAGRRHRIGFTLIELLIVIAIIGLLLALLIPAVQVVVESSRRLHCTANMKQIGIAMLSYQTNHEYFPATWVNGDRSWTWAKVTLPYTDYHDVLDDWDNSVDFDAGDNVEICATPVALFKCPTAPSPERYVYDVGGVAELYGTNDYKGCQSVNASDPLLAGWGLKNWIPGIVSRWPVRDVDVIDGLSNTLLIVESTGGVTIYGPDFKPYERTPKIWFSTDGAWMGRALSGMSPTNFGIRFQNTICGVNCTNMYDFGPFAFHPGGANVLLADGRAMFLTTDTDPLILCAFYAYADGQNPSPP